MTEPATPELADSPATPPTATAPAWPHALVRPLVTSDPAPEDPVPPATVEPPAGSGYWPDPNRYPPEQVERYLSEGRRRLGPTMRTFNLIAIGLGLVLLTVLLVAYNYHKNAGGPAVGGCLTGDQSTSTVVSCGSSSARYRVVGVVDADEEQSSSDTDVCAAYPDSIDSTWAGGSGGDGHVLCLGAPN